MCVSFRVTSPLRNWFWLCLHRGKRLSRYTRWNDWGTRTLVFKIKQFIPRWNLPRGDSGGARLELCSNANPSAGKLYRETANSSSNQLSFIWKYLTAWISVVILELIHAENPDFGRDALIRSKPNALRGFWVVHNNFYRSHSLALATVYSNFCPINFRW